jgi:integrase
MYPWLESEYRRHANLSQTRQTQARCVNGRSGRRESGLAIPSRQLARNGLSSAKVASRPIAARVLASLEKEVFPKLGHRPIAEIEAMELLEVLREIERRGALEIVSRVLQRCSAVFRYAVQMGRYKHNVAADLQGALKTPKRKHYSSLSILPEFLRKLADYDGHLQTRLGLRLLLLTATRTVELRAARWKEFDFDKAL